MFSSVTCGGVNIGDKKAEHSSTCVCLFNYCHLQYVTVTAVSLASPFNYSITALGNLQWLSDYSIYCMQN